MIFTFVCAEKIRAKNILNLYIGHIYQNVLAAVGSQVYIFIYTCVYERGYLRTRSYGKFMSMDPVYRLYITFSYWEVSGIASNRFSYKNRYFQVPKTCSNSIWERSYCRSKFARSVIPRILYAHPLRIILEII